jgi:hypothetical protein
VKLRFFIIFLILCTICTISVSAEVIGGNTTSPVAEPTTIPTTEPTAVPTPPPTTVPTTEPTAVPTTIPTVVTQTTAEPTITIPTVIPTELGGGKGWIDTYCNIDGATVYFDGAPQGNIAGGILSVAVTPTATPVRTISVSKSGYTSWSGPLSSMPASGEHVQVYATINPISTPTPVPPVQNGAIYAQSSPAGAAISMNGNFYGYSPVTIPNLPPGTYSMKATLSGYTPDTRLINVYTGQTASYYPTLQQSPPPPRSTGTVYAKSSPGGSQVFIDGTYNGLTPITLTLYPGNHNIVIKLSGYNDWSTSVYVTAGSSQTVNPGLTPAIFGSISLGSAPAGASVFMDSSYQGITNPSGALTLNTIPSGNHIIKLTAPGYNDWIETVYVKPNANTYVPVVMTRIGPNPTPVPAAGALNIVSTPSGADIFVDNIFRGYTPSTITEIDPGQHQILLKYTGYTDYSGTASVSPGQTTPLAIGMTPVPTPTPQSASSPAILIGGLLTIFGMAIIIGRRC